MLTQHFGKVYGHVRLAFFVIGYGQASFRGEGDKVDQMVLIPGLLFHFGEFYDFWFTPRLQGVRGKETLSLLISL